MAWAVRLSGMVDKDIVSRRVVKKNCPKIALEKSPDELEGNWEWIPVVGSSENHRSWRDYAATLVCI